ncbi:MAG: PIN domain-containing protein [Thermoanaerobaculia bacterium]|jgi:toxin-antitoxin system PIN domain toxin|nr:PIN domain-containing protein [Thermoanaerobaculia bacterium]MBP9823868.1 PIN domain-containing protein [Thermoanaerobaculia bacterium]
MIAFDTNLLFPALEPSHRDHTAAKLWITALDGDVAISELVLMELYVLVRNPAIAARPLAAAQAVALIETLRTNPRWRLLDAPEGVMATIWKKAAEPGFGRRRIFDARIGVSLVRQGVTELATRNVGAFQGLGFDRVFDPLAEP